MLVLFITAYVLIGLKIKHNKTSDETMVANPLNIRLTFDECNINFFDGKLPIPLFDLLHSFRTCGYFQYTMGGWFDKTVYNPIIFITDYYDFTEKQFMDIMVHEMIHYYLAYIGEDMKCKHGKKFKKIAEKLNQTYNLNIVIDVDLSQYKRRAGTPSLSYWFVKKIYYV